jgi:hypothetical protein
MNLRPNSDGSGYLGSGAGTGQVSVASTTDPSGQVQPIAEIKLLSFGDLCARETPLGGQTVPIWARFRRNQP